MAIAGAILREGYNIQIYSQEKKSCNFIHHKKNNYHKNHIHLAK
jgi:hypothetical protein